MCRYMRFRIPLISMELYTHTFLSAYLESPYSPEQLGALACKHWTNYQFNSASLLLFCQLLQVQLVLIVLDGVVVQ